MIMVGWKKQVWHDCCIKYDLMLFNYDLSDMSGETFAEISRISPEAQRLFWIAAKKLLSTKRVFSALPLPIWLNPLYQRFGR